MKKLNGFQPRLPNHVGMIDDWHGALACSLITDVIDMREGKSICNASSQCMLLFLSEQKNKTV